MMKTIRFIGMMIALLLVIHRGTAQEIETLLRGTSQDSSFYHVERISPNEYWVGGEYGILKKLDTLGQIQNIHLAAEGSHILKIQRWKDFVFLSADNGKLIRYNLTTNEWKIKSYTRFQNRCFYDFTINESGLLVLCGGHSKIAKGKKRLPGGFIALSDTGLTPPKIVWRSGLKFPFNMYQDSGKISVWIYNGFHSQIIQSSTCKEWKKSGQKIKGLVHGCISDRDTLLVCGSKSVRYKKSGMLGRISPGKAICYPAETGCIWDYKKLGNKWVALGRSGEISLIELKNPLWKPIRLPEAASLYDAIALSENKLLVVGHGKRLYFVRFRHP